MACTSTICQINHFSIGCCTCMCTVCRHGQKCIVRLLARAQKLCSHKVVQSVFADDSNVLNRTATSRHSPNHRSTLPSWCHITITQLLAFLQFVSSIEYIAPLALCTILYILWDILYYITFASLFATVSFRVHFTLYLILSNHCIWFDLIYFYSITFFKLINMLSVAVHKRIFPTHINTLYASSAAALTFRNMSLDESTTLYFQPEIRNKRESSPRYPHTVFNTLHPKNKSKSQTLCQRQNKNKNKNSLNAWQSASAATHFLNYTVQYNKNPPKTHFSFRDYCSHLKAYTYVLTCNTVIDLVAAFKKKKFFS